MTAVDSVAGEPAPRAGDAPPAGVAVVPAVKPLLRGWLHLIFFEASLVLGTLALVHAHGTVRITAMAVFAVSVSAMLGTSALYHRGNWAPAWHGRLQRLDHIMIFLLIAGTATPAFLIAVHGDARVAGLIAVWALTLIAATLRMARMNVPELVAGGMFVGLGWAAGLALPGVWLIRTGALYRALQLCLPEYWPSTTAAGCYLVGVAA